MNHKPPDWLTAWLDGVAKDSKTMSQRKLAKVTELRGGLALVKRLAKARGLHLLVLTDDKGHELIAASKHAFKVLC